MFDRIAEGKPPCEAFRGMKEMIARDDPSPPRAMPYGSDYQHLLAGRGMFKQRMRLWFKFANWC
ncbi:hypothetical protein EMIT0P44_350059 [Pseudomonas sp. IT-P44]